MAGNNKNANNKILGYKCALYSMALFLLAIAQSTFFAKINLFGATPDLLLGATLAIAMHDDQRASSIAGIVAGFFYYALGGGSPLYIIFAFLCGYTFFSISEKAFSKNLPSFLALGAIIYAAKAAFNLIVLYFSASSFDPVNAMVKILIPEFISSLFFSSLSYLVFYPLSRIFNSKSSKRKDYIYK